MTAPPVPGWPQDQDESPVTVVQAGLASASSPVIAEQEPDKENED